MLLFIILSGFILLFIVFFIYLILRSTLTLRVKCLISTRHLEIHVTVYLWNKKVWAYQSEPEQLNKRKNPSTTKDDMGEERDMRSTTDDWSDQLRKAITVLRSLHVSDHVRISDLAWITTCGTGDASETAILCGALWSVKASVMPWIGPFCEDKPRINVVPFFQRKCLSSNLSCMFHIRTGDAIAMIKKIRGQWKEG
ncbi:DUF2953 domain-containing protein [Sporolactobacillus laevolacticus]|uniref:DUF2953 domain-containing protein n=1 Tax=Sporolactobacillus laevolacticus TaxID=33018 RepID=UPI0025B51618|nr:DUF2953 domain-containing protein [Sporolactobacillus laevolacticus]MDN3955653.1 DUF2953 domain-containing protein [Sporolactobacillus laevolacticus]